MYSGKKTTNNRKKNSNFNEMIKINLFYSLASHIDNDQNEAINAINRQFSRKCFETFGQNCFGQTFSYIIETTNKSILVCKCVWLKRIDIVNNHSGANLFRFYFKIKRKRKTRSQLCCINFFSSLLTIINWLARNI